MWRLLFGVLFWAGCSSGTVDGGERVLALVDTDPRWWSRSVLTTMVEDTVSGRDLGLLVRFDRTFDRRPVTLSIRTQAPGGAWAEDRMTVSFVHMRRGNRDFGEVVVPWREDVVFPRRGSYVFVIGGVPVRGIRAIGITENGEK